MKKNSIFVSDAAKIWDIKSKSSRTGNLVSTMEKFGLIETNQSGDKKAGKMRKIAVSDLGFRILSEKRETEKRNYLRISGESIRKYHLDNLIKILQTQASLLA